MKQQEGNMGVIVAFSIVVAVIIGVVFVLMHKGAEAPSDIQTISENTPQAVASQKQDAQSKSKKSMDTSKRLLSNFTPIAHVEKLEKIDTVVGTGAEVAPGAFVSVHYTGALAATGEVFQSSKDFGTDPISFPLSGVIKGWTDGIPGMKIGGTRRLVIPAVQAYGANPDPRSGIPANADLVFDVELIGIK